jgi:hypothetical protein
MREREVRSMRPLWQRLSQPAPARRLVLSSPLLRTVVGSRRLVQVLIGGVPGRQPVVRRFSDAFQEPLPSRRASLLATERAIDATERAGPAESGDSGGGSHGAAPTLAMSDEQAVEQGILPEPDALVPPAPPDAAAAGRSTFGVDPNADQPFAGWHRSTVSNPDPGAAVPAQRPLAQQAALAPLPDRVAVQAAGATFTEQASRWLQQVRGKRQETQIRPVPAQPDPDPAPERVPGAAMADPGDGDELQSPTAPLADPTSAISPVELIGAPARRQRQATTAQSQIQPASPVALHVVSSPTETPALPVAVEPWESSTTKEARTPGRAAPTDVDVAPLGTAMALEKALPEQGESDGASLPAAAPDQSGGAPPLPQPARVPGPLLSLTTEATGPDGARSPDAVHGRAAIGEPSPRLADTSYPSPELGDEGLLRAPSLEGTGKSDGVATPTTVTARGEGGSGTTVPDRVLVAGPAAQPSAPAADSAPSVSTPMTVSPLGVVAASAPESPVGLPLSGPPPGEAEAVDIVRDTPPTTAGASSALPPGVASIAPEPVRPLTAREGGLPARSAGSRGDAGDNDGAGTFIERLQGNREPGTAPPSAHPEETQPNGGTAATSSPASAPAAWQPPGALSTFNRDSLTSLTGIDPASVTIRQDAAAEAVTAVRGADALTVGEEILLGGGLAPDMPSTLGLLAHELTHVAQARRPRYVPPVLREPLRVDAPAPDGPPLATVSPIPNARLVAVPTLRPTEPAAAPDHSTRAEPEDVARAVEARVTGLARERLTPAYPVWSADPAAHPASSSHVTAGSWNGLPAPWEPMPSWAAEPSAATAPSAPPSSPPLTVGPLISATGNGAVTSGAATVVSAAETGRLLPTPGSPAVKAAPAQPEPDLDALARQVYTILGRRLSAERRRLG